ncbi:MAG: PqqD family protein [Bacteroidales bacterium]|nr:PqqD family protein [Candidatus Colimorpha pelethequi]MCQ2262353.1 PqqD family protein [Bacteroidales bacterium]
MKINPKFKVRDVAGEHIILLQGKNAGEMTKVVSLNSTSLLLWEQLKDKDFEPLDVVAILLENYDVEEAVALEDAKKWIETLRQNGIIYDPQ